VFGLPREAARTRAAHLLELTGLSEFADKRPQQLSGGMKQRAAFCRALLADPQMLLLDEPFGALDALTRSMMQRWLLDIWAKHRRTVLFITHDIDEAIFLGDRVAVMAKDPGRFQSITPVNLPRPRSRSSYEFVRIRKSGGGGFFAEEEEPFAFSI